MILCSVMIHADWSNNEVRFEMAYEVNPNNSQTVQNDIDIFKQELLVSKMPQQSGRKRSTTAQKKEFDAYVAASTKKLIEAVHKAFQGDVSALYPVIKKAIETNSMHLPEVKNSLMHQTIAHMVTTAQTNRGVMSKFKNHPWMQNKDLSCASIDDQIGLNYMISRVYSLSNDTIVELVQNGLKSWDRS